MTSHHRTSLRGLARRLGCTHGALSKAIDKGRLTEGIAVGPRGEAIVVDPEAAARQWHEVHVDVLRIDGRRRAAPAASAPPPRGVWVDLTWPPMRHALEDPLLAAHPMAVFCLIDSHLRDAPDPAAAAAELLARTAIGMPDVDELLAREVARWLEDHDEDDGKGSPP